MTGTGFGRGIRIGRGRGQAGSSAKARRRGASGFAMPERDPMPLQRDAGRGTLTG